MSEDHPHLFPLSHHKSSAALQGLALLPKNVCVVRDVEFARFICLTSSSIEPLSFTVPRVKSEYFQDDLFPPTRVAWEPALKGTDWLAGARAPVKRIDLKPSDMETRKNLHFTNLTNLFVKKNDYLSVR